MKTHSEVGLCSYPYRDIRVCNIHSDLIFIGFSSKSLYFVHKFVHEKKFFFAHTSDDTSLILDGK